MSESKSDALPLGDSPIIWVLLSRSTRTADAGRVLAPQNPASFPAAGAARSAPPVPLQTMQTRRLRNRSPVLRRNSQAIQDDARLPDSARRRRTAGRFDPCLRKR